MLLNKLEPIYIYAWYESQCFPLVLSGFNDTGEYWRSWYETPTFEQDVRTLFEELEPLYVELHAYVRKRLKEKYGKDMFPETGHIPAHLFGTTDIFLYVSEFYF